MFDFAPMAIIRETGFKGVRLDYNGGVRIGIPKGKTAYVVIKNANTDTVLYEGEWEGNKAYVDTLYYIEYEVEITVDGETYVDRFDLENQKVFIRISSTAIGDSIMCIPYIEEFRRIHNCNISVAVIDPLKDLFKANYPNLDIIDIGEDITQAPTDSYASYILSEYKGVTDKMPINTHMIDLQYSPAYILGLAIEKLKPCFKATTERVIKEPYVCIAVQASGQAKLWNNEKGWQEVTDYLRKLGYRVLCIDKTFCNDYLFTRVDCPMGAENFTGNRPFQERVNLLRYADFFIGLSSGLAWLAYGCDCPSIVISGFTLPSKEFPTPYRIYNPHTCKGCETDNELCQVALFDKCPKNKDWECTRLIPSKFVVRTIDRVTKDIQCTTTN